MLKWLSEMFEKVCSFFVIVNFVICGIAGGTIGYNIGDGDICINLLCFIGGLLIAFFINVINFGFLVQIIEIRKKVDSLEKIVELLESDLINKLTE